MILQKSFYYADLVLKKHFLLLSMLKTVVLLNYYFFYCENCDTFFSIFFSEEQSLLLLKKKKYSGTCSIDLSVDQFIEFSIYNNTICTTCPWINFFVDPGTTFHQPI